jgi:hypothetical protein
VGGRTVIGAARCAFAACIGAARCAFAIDRFGLAIFLRPSDRRKCFEGLALRREPCRVFGNELRPIAGKLHISLSGSHRQRPSPIVRVRFLIEVHFKKADPLAELAQVIGFEQGLARLDDMFHGLHGIFLGPLMFAQRSLGELVRRLGDQRWVG